VIDQLGNGCGRGLRILEYLLLFGKKADCLSTSPYPFIAVGQEGKKHLHFRPALLKIADIIKDNGIIWKGSDP